MILICKTLSPFYQRMLYAKIGLNWPISSGKNFFNIFRKYIFGISWLPPLEKGHGPSLEQTGILITQGCFMPSLVEIGQVVLERKIFKFPLCIFPNYLPWKRVGPFICTNLNSLYPRMLCAKFGWNWSSGSGEKMKMWKVYNYANDNNRQRTNFDQKKLTWAFSSNHKTFFGEKEFW